MLHLECGCVAFRCLLCCIWVFAVLHLDFCCVTLGFFAVLHSGFCCVAFGFLLCCIWVFAVLHLDLCCVAFRCLLCCIWICLFLFLFTVAAVAHGYVVARNENQSKGASSSLSTERELKHEAQRGSSARHLSRALSVSNF